MCERGTEVLLEVTIPAHLSHTSAAYKKRVGIDACIAPLVKALNDGGVETWASCCGHGLEPGQIMLADGRVLLVCGDALTAKCVGNDLKSGDLIVTGAISKMPVGTGTPKGLPLESAVPNLAAPLEVEASQPDEAETGPTRERIEFLATALANSEEATPIDTAAAAALRSLQRENQELRRDARDYDEARDYGDRMRQDNIELRSQLTEAERQREALREQAEYWNGQAGHFHDCLLNERETASELIAEAERQLDEARAENVQVKKLLDLKLTKASDDQVSELLEPSA